MDSWNGSLLLFQAIVHLFPILLFENVFLLISGKDTLRCLALATVDEPPAISDMKLEDSSSFSQYEVFNRNNTISTFFGCWFAGRGKFSIYNSIGSV